MFLYARIKTPVNALAGLSGRVYDGQVPKAIQTDASGYVLPYVVLYAGVPGDLPADRDATGLVDTGVLDWPFQTTCVGASALICMSLARDVQLALTNLRVGDGYVKPDGFTTPVPLPDNQVTPARFFLPLQWRLITT